MREFLTLIRHNSLRKLLVLRWSGQITDGIFQSALASFVLFSPERQATAMAAALGFTVVLMPYSIVGPLVGTLLDRTSRQRVVFYSNLSRAITLIFIAILIFLGRTGILLTLFILITFGINRLLLAGLSAGLPLMIDRPNLIKANALAVTGGSVFVVLGGGTGIALRRAINSIGNANHADGILMLVAVLGYLATTGFAMRIKRNELGPLPHEEGTPNWFFELSSAWRFLKGHSDAARAITATALQRGGLTALTIIGLLLERNTFHNSVDTEAGLAGVSTAITFAGFGLVIGAVIAPWGVEKFGRHRWIRLMVLVGATTPFLIGFINRSITLFIAAFMTAAAGQSMKVTTDALVQSKITDDFRGRTFALYDMAVNTAIVSGALLAATVTPTSGKTTIVPLAISVLYLIIGVVILNPSRFTGSSTN